MEGLRYASQKQSETELEAVAQMSGKGRCTGSKMKQIRRYAAGRFLDQAGIMEEGAVGWATAMRDRDGSIWFENKEVQSKNVSVYMKAALGTTFPLTDK